MLERMVRLIAILIRYHMDRDIWRCELQQEFIDFSPQLYFWI